MAVVFPVEKSYAAGSLNLLYNQQMLIDIGSQGQWADKTGNDDYNQSCSAFCLTYAHALITNGNEINDPSYYWGGSPWPKAGYTADYYNSNDYNKLLVLQKAYDELNDRRLPILFVTLGGYTNEGPYRHYVLVVGYQNVTSRDSLTEGNFLVIDPNQPSMVKTLGKTGYGGQVTLGYGGRVGIAYSKATNERVHWFGGWGMNDTNHWRDCIDPGCPDGARWYDWPHDYDNGADTTCNTCGYVRNIHTHTYGDWSMSDTNHWHECTDANCPDKTGSIKDNVPHVYTNDEDASCDICTYVRSITPPAHEHTYGDWSKDGTNHWHECTDANCTDKVGSIKDTAAHVYDNDADTDCNVCGYVRSITPPAHEHTYGDWSKDGTNHWHECTDANCTDKVGSIKDTAAHVYDNDADTDCNVCGYVRSITPPAHEHTYGDWSKDGTNHWHECTDANCTDKVGSIKDTAAHVYDNDADTDCNVCGYVRSITPPAHEHTYGEWSKDGTNHWHECTDANCTDKVGSIKDTAAHSFKWVIDKAATATEKGLKHEECTVCGYKRTAVEIPATGTTTGGNTGGGSHWHLSVTTTPVPVIVIPPKTGDMTIWQSILRFLGIR